MTLGREGGRRNPEYVLLLNPLDQRIRDLSIRLSHYLVSGVGAVAADSNTLETPRKIENSPGKGQE